MQGVSHRIGGIPLRGAPAKLEELAISNPHKPLEYFTLW